MTKVPNKQWEKKIKRENWLERNGNWYYPFKGTLFAGAILLTLHHIYECLTAYITNF